MSSSRTAWHVAFAALLHQRAPSSFDVVPELQLSNEPQRADLLLVRRHKPTLPYQDARVLRGLWPRISVDALVEFKSVSRPVRPSDLIRLLGYGAQYHATQRSRVSQASDLTLVLVVASLTRTLFKDLMAMGWSLGPGEDGYYPVTGAVYPCWVAVLDSVSQAEKDELIGAFGHKKTLKGEDLQWWREHIVGGTLDVAMNTLEGFDEMTRKFLASLPPERIAEVLAPEQRLAGLAPEQRLAGLAPEETLLALPVTVLKAFPSAYIAMLPEAVRREIELRLQADSKQWQK